MSAKSKGIRLEREVKNELERNGFFVVRQAASKFPDLVAIKKCKKFYGKNSFVNLYFIECKYKRENFTHKDKLKLLALSSRYGGYPVLAYKEGNKVKLYNITTGLFIRYNEKNGQD